MDSQCVCWMRSASTWVTSERSRLLSGLWVGLPSSVEGSSRMEARLSQPEAILRKAAFGRDPRHRLCGRPSLLAFGLEPGSQALPESSSGPLWAQRGHPGPQRCGGSVLAELPGCPSPSRGDHLWKRTDGTAWHLGEELGAFSGQSSESALKTRGVVPTPFYDGLARD